MLLRHISTTVLAQAYAAVFGVLTSVVINRALQPEGKGVLAAYLTAVNFIVLFGTWGLPKAYTYEVGRSQSARRVISTSVAVALANGVLVALLTIPLTQVNLGGVFAQMEGLLFGLAVPTTLATILFGAFNAILRGMNQIAACNVGLILYQTLYFGLNALTAATTQLTIEWTVTNYILSYLAALVYYFIMIRRADPGFAVSWQAVRGLFRYGLRYQLYSVVMMLHTRIDVFLIGLLLTDAQLGYYATAVTIAQMIWNLPLAITFVMLPYVASHQHEGDVTQRTALVIRASTLLLVGVAILLAVIAPFAIEWLYEAAYLPAVGPLRVLLPGVVAFSIVQIAGADLMGRDRLLPLTLLSGSILVVNIVLNVLLIPPLGVEGAALTSTLTYSVNAVLIAVLLTQDGAVTLREVLLPGWQDVRLLVGATRGLVRRLPRLALRPAADR